MNLNLVYEYSMVWFSIMYNWVTHTSVLGKRPAAQSQRIARHGSDSSLRRKAVALAVVLPLRSAARWLGWVGLDSLRSQEGRQEIVFDAVPEVLVGPLLPEKGGIVLAIRGQQRGAFAVVAVRIGAGRGGVRVVAGRCRCRCRRHFRLRGRRGPPPERSDARRRFLHLS